MKYLDIAAEANAKAKELLTMVPDDQRPAAAVIIGQLVNYGIRINPRACHGTIRLNAVKRACDGLPCVVTMDRAKDDRTGEEFNALSIVPKA